MVTRDLRFLDAQEDAGSTDSDSDTASDTEDDIYEEDIVDVLAAQASSSSGGDAAADKSGRLRLASPGTPSPLPGRKITIKLAGHGADLTCHVRWRFWCVSYVCGCACKYLCLASHLYECNQRSKQHPCTYPALNSAYLAAQVCGQKGHCAGFIGARYVDCPNKPCYLCGQSGHSTMTCPYRADPGHGCAPAGPSTSAAQELAGREAGEAAAEAAFEAPSRAWHVDAAALRLHDKRVTCLEFHPSNDALVLSGSKGGRIAVWDMDRVYERTVYRDINRWQTMGLKFLPGGDAVATCSQDGTVKARARGEAGGVDADGRVLWLK